MTLARKTSAAAVLVSVAALAAGCTQQSRSPSEAESADRGRAAEELSDAATVLAEMNQIPLRHRQRARCVVVVPSLVRAGLVVGGRHGHGVASCRVGGGWSGPVFVTISGGSAGFQVGVESSDVVMLVASDRGMDKLFRTRFAVGADASAAAGPVGEAAAAGTDASMTAELVTYARSRGLFAGAEISGAVVEQDRGALAAVYGGTPDVHAVLSGQVPPPAEAWGFLQRLTAAFPPPAVASSVSGG
jgi:lipid-binding SYLF domain-containing protein